MMPSEKWSKSSAEVERTTSISELSPANAACSSAV